MYSDLYLRRKGLPLGRIVAVVAAIAIGGFGMYYGFLTQPFNTQASNEQLNSREIVNLSFNQAGILWETEEPQTGWVVYGTEPDTLTRTVSDERDSTDSKTAYTHHYVMMNSLEPDTTYYYQIVSDNQVYRDDDNQPFSFQTPKQFAAVGASQPAYGKVSLPSGEPADNSIVRVTYPGAFPLVTYTKLTGEWLIPIRFAVNKESLQPFPLQEDDILSIEITHPDGSEAAIEAMVSNANPFPQTIVLGNEYDFTSEQSVIPDQMEALSEDTEGATPEGDLESETPLENADDQPTEELFSPTPEPQVQGAATQQVLTDLAFEFPLPNAQIPSGRPLIKGTGVPETRVRIVLDSDPPYRISSLVNAEGEWMAEIPRPLPAGTYTLTLTGVTRAQTQATLYRSFTIAKSGENVLGEATESGELSPTEPEPELSPLEPAATDIPTTVPSPTEEIISPPTSTPLPLPTQESDPAEFDLTSAPTKQQPGSALSPSPTPQAVAYLPTATPIPPVSGGNGLLVSFTALGLLIAGAVSIFFL